MERDDDFKNFILDQLLGLEAFETKNMFGVVSLLYHGYAFAKIKHDKLWLKVDEGSKTDFENLEMKQYTYGKGNTRKLNFFETPVEVIEDRDKLKEWAKRSMKIAI